MRIVSYCDAYTLKTCEQSFLKSVAQSNLLQFTEATRSDLWRFS